MPDPKLQGQPLVVIDAILEGVADLGGRAWSWPLAFGRGAADRGSDHDSQEIKSSLCSSRNDSCLDLL